MLIKSSRHVGPIIRRRGERCGMGKAQVDGAYRGEVVRVACRLAMLLQPGNQGQPLTEADLVRNVDRLGEVDVLTSKSNGHESEKAQVGADMKNSPREVHE